MPEAIISDASALIALEKIDSLDILCKIYSEIILPEAVINEFGTPTILIVIKPRRLIIH